MKRLVLVVIVALVSAACGGRNTADSGGLATLEDEIVAGVAGDAATATVDAEEALLAFAACMRENGYPGFPDPTVNADGSIEFGFRGGALEDLDIDPRSDEFRVAMEACQDLLEGVAFGPRGGGEFDITELQDQLLAMAACLRDKGFDVDDPDLSGFGGGPGGGAGPGGGFGDALDFSDPDVQAAMEACREEIGLTGPGIGGQGFGGPPPNGGEGGPPPPDGNGTQGGQG